MTNDEILTTLATKLSIILYDADKASEALNYLRPIIAQDVLNWLGAVTQLAAFKDHLINSYVDLYLYQRGAK